MTEEVKSKKGTAKKTAVAGGGLLGVGALAFLALGTGANWTDSEAVGADFQSGAFDVEVSVDGGETWATDTVSYDEESVIIDWADLQYASVLGGLGPGEELASSLQVRLAPDTTHDADIEFNVYQDDVFESNFSLEIVDEMEGGVASTGESFTASLSSDNELGAEETEVHLVPVVTADQNDLDQGIEDANFVIEITAESINPLDNDDDG